MKAKKLLGWNPGPKSLLVWAHSPSQGQTQQPRGGGQSPLEGTSRKGRGLARLLGPHKKGGNKERLPKQGWRALGRNLRSCLSPQTT